MEISAEQLAEQLAAIEAGKTTFREAAERLARTLAPATGQFQATPAVDRASPAPPTSRPEEIKLVVRGDDPQILLDALEIAARPAFSLANQRPPQISLDPNGSLTYRFPPWYRLPVLVQRLTWPPPGNLVQLWRKQLQQIDQACLENRWTLNLIGWDDFYVDQEGLLQIPLLSLRLAEAKYAATGNCGGSLADAFATQFHGAPPQSGAWLDVAAARANHDLPTSTFSLNHSLANQEPAQSSTASILDTAAQSTAAAAMKKRSNQRRRSLIVLGATTVLGLAVISAAAWWNGTSPTQSAASGAAAAKPPAKQVDEPTVIDAAPLQTIVPLANQLADQTEESGDDHPDKAEQTIAPEIERLLSAPLPDLSPENFSDQFAVDATGDEAITPGAEPIEGAGDVPEAQPDNIPAGGPQHAPAISLRFTEDRQSLNWNLATVPNLRRCTASLEVIPRAAANDQDAAVDAGESDQPAYRWLVAIAEQTGRTPRGLLELSEADESDVRVRIRFDLRLAKQVQLNIRQAATIDGGLTFFPASETSLLAMLDQLTAQKVAIENQLQNVRNLLELAERTETRKALRRRRSELEELEKWSQQALARMAELRQLVARIETMLAVELRVAEQPSEATEQAQLILATDQLDGP